MNSVERHRYDILRVMTPETGTFAMAIGVCGNSEEQAALEWLQHHRWITLIDVTPIAAAPGLYRIFMASEEARTWFRKQS